MTTEHAQWQTRDGRRYLVLTRHLDAPVADVWRFLTDPEALSRWFGTWRGDPASGTVEVWMLFEGDEAPWETYEIDACTAPVHLAVRSTGDNAWILDLHLAEAGQATTLDFAQQAVPGDMADIAAGWDYYLDRLVAAASGGDASEIGWEPYEKRMAAYRELLSTN